MLGTGGKEINQLLEQDNELMEKHLNIIALTVPYPVDYGGVFDLFHKLVALHKKGVQIHLHCFDYGRGKQKELEKYCAEVFYYSRNSFLNSFFKQLPYIVSSRINTQLFSNLLSNNYPILMEGLHCSYLLNDERFAGRKCFIRLHNIESDYYADLAKNEQNLFRRLYYQYESRLLKKYEQKVAANGSWLAVTGKDAKDFEQKFGCKDIVYLPLFLPEWKVKSAEGFGDFCLYHGDLSVASNSKMATLLIKHVFEQTSTKFIIAGKNPPDFLKNMAFSYANVELVSNPSELYMQQLIAQAHINILPSFSNTGIKLKLLNALYNGRHCLVNEATVKGTGLESVCKLSSLSNMRLAMIDLFKMPFTADDVEQRKNMLNNLFHNDSTADTLIKLIWD